MAALGILLLFAGRTLKTWEHREYTGSSSQQTLIHVISNGNDLSGKLMSRNCREMISSVDKHALHVRRTDPACFNLYQNRTRTKRLYRNLIKCKLSDLNLYRLIINDRFKNQQIPIGCQLKIQRISLYNINRLVIHGADLGSSCNHFPLFLCQICLHLQKPR